MATTWGCFICHVPDSWIPAEREIEEQLKKDAARIRSNLRHLQGDAPELLNAWKKLFKYTDDHLDTSDLGRYLASPDAAGYVRSSIYKGESLGHYRLHRYCIMSNHVHLLIEPLPENVLLDCRLHDAQWPPLYYCEEARRILCGGKDPKDLVWRALSDVMKSLKGASSRAIKKLMFVDGPVWKDESYDHWVRDADEYLRIISYIDKNPVGGSLQSAGGLGLQQRRRFCRYTVAIH